ncbi:topology modulation protein [Allostreptomyces psammosilenae]|uniref:Adenylate kinase family enzyme n=1 Tax=Allostreptomyces psammosilenae TaxID=1892865 RepID=A0A852ZSZ3_9ACTN|nr:topology modulation protein [Allostreptomyces psammosilenae]NYI05546.1 adenylate kinase family enzyme [Allostreptomyces psammosilenae]
MKRVAVVGCGGSGKSYVSRRLGQQLGVPVTHLDSVYFDDSWQPLPMPEFEAVQRRLVAEPCWVIDGNYNSTLHVRLAACDTVVMLDPSTISCLWGAVSRQLRHGPGQHKERGVYNRVSWAVLRYIWGYRRSMRPRVLAKIRDLAPAHAQVVRLTSRRQARRWLDQLPAR